jgi:hypothetical protein
VLQVQKNQVLKRLQAREAGNLVVSQNQMRQIDQCAHSEAKPQGARLGDVRDAYKVVAREVAKSERYEVQVFNSSEFYSQTALTLSREV